MLLCNFIEIALQHECSPVNLLHIFRTTFPRNTSGWLLLHFFIEFRLSGGQLFDKICELEYLTEVDACIYIKQVLEAIDHLHDNNIVHLDIKVNTGIKSQGEFLLKKALATFL